MPNGLPSEERDWSNWRGQITSQLETMTRWTDRHEREEFAHHERVEIHMAETAKWIAQSSQHRQELAKTVANVEVDVRRIDRDVEALKARLNIMLVVGMPIAGWALYQIAEHFIAGGTP